VCVFNHEWVDTQWQQYSTHLHTNNIQNTENGTYNTTYHHFIEYNSKMEEAANVDERVDEEKARLQTQLSPKRIGNTFTATPRNLFLNIPFYF
jgi:hypothetical protein